jgi:hypothetical protein
MREEPMRVMKHCQGNANLLQIVLATRPSGCFADPLHGWNQQADQDADDGNDYEQFQDSEAVPS